MIKQTQLPKPEVDEQQVLIVSSHLLIRDITKDAANKPKNAVILNKRLS